MQRKDKNYIDARQFTELLVTYQYTEDEKILETLIKNCFYPLVRGVLIKFRFGLVDPEDALQECVMACVNQIKSYNPNHATTNPYSTGLPQRKAFSFFTTCVVNYYKGLYRDEVSRIRRQRTLMDLESQRFYRDNPTIKAKKQTDMEDDHSLPNE